MACVPKSQRGRLTPLRFRITNRDYPDSYVFASTRQLGDELSLTLRYESITFNSGTKVDLPSEGVVIFTGPNNAGKSQALRDILGYVQDGIEYGGTVLSAAETTR